jgi:hypothetical protein
MPAPGEPHFDEMVEELDRVFSRYADEGKVTLEHDTLLYYGRFAI